MRASSEGENIAPYFDLTTGYMAYSKIITVKNQSVTVTYAVKDDDSDILTFSLTAEPEYGSASVNSETGAVTYTPDIDDTGSDSLTGSVSDNKDGTASMAVPVTIISDSFIRVACIGDSLTFGSGGSRPYTDTLKEKLGGRYWVENFGLPATTLMSDTSYPYTQTAFYGNSLGFNPHIAVIMLGTNDTITKSVVSRPDAFRSDYEALINSYKSLPSKPSVFLVMPPQSKEKATQKNLEKFVWPVVEQLVKETDCKLILLHEAVSTDSDSYYDDYHFNDTGYARFGALVYDAVSKLNPDELPALQTNIHGWSEPGSAAEDSLGKIFALCLIPIGILAAGVVLGILLYRRKNKKT